jgi:ribosome-associated translation inhibitor RaiA
MPDGVVQWFDPATGEGRIIHAGRRYAVRGENMESTARLPGARVHFDVARGPADTAVNVVHRAGTRTSKHHRRFGTLSGARAADTTGGAASMTRLTSLGRDLEGHPARVAELWSSLLAAADIENLVRLYAPNASLLADGEVMVGPVQIRRYWASSPLLGAGCPSATGDQDSMVMLIWDPDPDGAMIGSRMWIAHGEIAEQWLGNVTELSMSPQADEETPLVLSASNNVSSKEWNYAIDKIGKVLESLDEPVLFASVRLERSADPARERGATARVTLDLNGEPVRAHVAADHMEEAIDLLEARVRDRLRHLSEHRQALRRRGPASEPGSWRHGNAATPRSPYFPRPADDREIVRHKTYTTAETTVDEAVFDMESMDYDFFLFTDLASGQDAVVWRETPGYRLRLSDGATEPLDQPSAAAAELEAEPAATLSLDEARAHLDRNHAPWVFFNDTASGRGQVLYRRYDGHYGLITPAGELA